MTVALLAVLAVVVVALWLRGGADPLALADRPLRPGEPDPVLPALHRMEPAAQPTAYHQVLQRLWDAYDRERALFLSMDFARRHREAPTAQYWLRQFLEVEPELAKAHLDEAFLRDFFDPATAAKCGSYG